MFSFKSGVQTVTQLTEKQPPCVSNHKGPEMDQLFLFSSESVVSSWGLSGVRTERER